jgi:FixJ family two-component response regulator
VALRDATRKVAHEPERPRRGAASGVQGAHVAAYRALIVDDERNIRLTLRTAVEGPDLEVSEASDGREALDRLGRARYDVVLLDLRLPGMDGLEVLRRLRERSPSTRVVVITAHGTVDAAVEAMKLGAADFLQKPFDPHSVREVVTRALHADASAASYADLVATARREARAGGLDAAQAAAGHAVARDPSRPDAYHLLGVVCDLRGDRLPAQAYYRAALALDPAHRPSEANLDRSVGVASGTPLRFGDEDAKPAR